MASSVEAIISPRIEDVISEQIIHRRSVHPAVIIESNALAVEQISLGCVHAIRGEGLCPRKQRSTTRRRQSIMSKRHSTIEQPQSDTNKAETKRH